jgi:hypothetical protein
VVGTQIQQIDRLEPSQFDAVHQEARTRNVNHNEESRRKKKGIGETANTFEATASIDNGQQQK